MGGILLKVSIVLILFILFSCNSKQPQVKKNESEIATFDDIVEKDSLVYVKNENILFSGTIVKKESLQRIVQELNYSNGKKNGQEIHYKYFYSDVPIVVLEGNWSNGKKTGIWKSHDGSGQMTIIRDYDKIK
jgi:antitoxin component YwqK of YwqJK toxin-antitoxin module